MLSRHIGNSSSRAIRNRQKLERRKGKRKKGAVEGVDALR